MVVVMCNGSNLIEFIILYPFFFFFQIVITPNVFAGNSQNLWCLFYVYLVFEQDLVSFSGAQLQVAAGSCGDDAACHTEGTWLMDVEDLPILLTAALPTQQGALLPLLIHSKKKLNHIHVQMRWDGD